MRRMNEAVSAQSPFTGCLRAQGLHRRHAEGTRMAILGWILFGLIVGALAKLVMPGRDPGGIIVTMLIGIAGAVLGGVIGRMLGFYGPREAAGFLMSLLGAVVLLWAYRMFIRKPSVTRP
jgi:uncharacterized membrane protein YeaQ/YmgE (transglycosylase-associated protein family)